MSPVPLGPGAILGWGTAVARTAGAALAAGLALAACAPGLSPASTTRSAGDAAQRAATSTFSRDGWKTDFSIHSVPLSEITSGGPPRDGIPPLDHPAFVSPAEAATWLGGKEPVIALELAGDSRAYPLQIMIWHEIVNDQFGDIPVAVTFCPLCHSAIAFDRRVAGQSQVLDFGTTGNLRLSDLVMWDRQTESWWQQATGMAIVGRLTGTVLTELPAAIVSFDTFRGQYPTGRVLSRDTGFDRAYGRNPYSGYDDASTRPFLFTGTADGRLQPKERVVTVSSGGEDAAYPYSVLARLGVAADTVGGSPVVVFFTRGTTSALGNSSLAEAEDVGATGVFMPVVNGRSLTFRAVAGGFEDEQTHSQWNLFGIAVSGPLAGRRLQPVIHGDYFWFAWAAFRPNTRIYRG